MRVSEIDPHDVMRELGFAEPISASVLAENRGKAVWRIEGDFGTFALRILRPGEHETALAERRAMDLARAAGAPAPQVLSAGTWHRRPAMLQSWCEGQTVTEALRARPWAAIRLAQACGRAQARLNAVPAPPEFASTRWVDRFGPLDPELVGRLESAEASHSGMLHLDYHPDNILVAGGAVTGVVDWTNACAGDGRADLARTWALLTRRSGQGVRARTASWLRTCVAAGWQRGYEQIAGRQHDMLLFRIWALTGLSHSLRAEAGRPGSATELTLLLARIARLRNRAGLLAAVD